MRRIKTIGLALVAAIGLVAVAASSAAAQGPQYLTSGGLTTSANVTTSNLGSFTLKPTSGPVVVCTGLSAPTTIFAGAPGKSESTIQFSGCTVKESPKCDANSKGATGGNITVNALDELVYDGTKAEAEKEEAPLGDLFTTNEAQFVTLTFEALEAGACPNGAVETQVTGDVVGEVEPVNTMSVQGMLTFPTTSLKKVYRWKGVGVKPEELAVGLKVFGLSATESGLADLELSPSESWGALSS